MNRAVLALTALALAPAPMFAASVTGTWQIDGSVQDSPVKPVCVLTEQDGNLTGTCSGTDGKPVPIKGTVKDKSIKWQYDTAYQGSAITISFTGSLDQNDRLVGGIFVEPYSVDGSFTATRVKAGSTPPVPPPA